WRDWSSDVCSSDLVRNRVEGNGYPRAVQLRKLHCDMDVLNPYGGILGGNSFYSPDSERCRIHPDLPKQQRLRFALRDNQQDVFRNDAEVFPAQEGKVVVLPTDLVIVAIFCGSRFLIQNRANDLFSTRTAARLRDFVRFCIRRSEADVRGNFRDELLIVGTEDFIFSRYLVGP